MKSRYFCLLAAAVSSASLAVAQPSSVVESAIAAGQAGERYDGYMGVVGVASPQLTRQIQAINIRRRNLYIELASRRNVAPEIVGIATGCELLARIPVGEAYMLSDGSWRRRAPGQPAPAPERCR
jgi:uncharacterized protein YdbL (DUF1318 family)